MKRILSLLVALCMICTLLPATVLAADTQIVFELGTNGTASHTDGSTATTYSETVDGYTLSITGGTKMYKGARDAKGNACIKLGTSSAVGSFSFTVPDDVTSVVIAVAKYKTNTTKVTINGTTTTLTKNSNDGEYDEITVDTSSTKTVSLTTVSGGARAMVNSITFVIAAAETEPPVTDCDHTNTVELPGKEATCTESGLTAGEKCADCDTVITAQETIPATGHDYAETVKDATCTETGLKTEICSVCGDTKETVIPTTDHNYVDGTCTGCGAAEPNEVESTITFDTNKTQRTEYSTSKQVWENDGVSFTNNKSSSTTNVADYGAPVRLYANSSITIESSEGNISKIVFDCNSGSYATALNNSIGTVDGATVTVSSDKVTVEFAEPVESFTIAKLTAQVRMDGLTVTSVKAGDASCPHTNKDTLPAEAPTCTEDGLLEGWVCTDCGYEEQEVDPATGHDLADGEKVDATCTEPGLTAGQYCTKCDYTEQEVIPAGHKYENGVCSGCGQELPNEATITFDDTSKRTEFSTEKQVWLENSITITNNKEDSASNVADYSNPIRLYKSSTLTITYPAAICQIVFDCNSTSYANVIEESLATAGGTVLQFSDKVVFVPATPAASFTFTMSAATRLDSITVACNVAEVDGVWYTNLDAAMENTTGTLKLLADLFVGTFNVPETSEIIIDLNGKTLTASAIVATVMDSADGEGLVEAESAVLNSVAGQMILWDNTSNASGYRVFQYTMDNMTSGGEATEAEQEKGFNTIKTFWNVLRFTNTNAYTLIASGNSGLNTVTFTLAWGGAEKTYAVTSDVIAEWALKEEAERDTDFGFYIRVTGFENLETSGDLTVTATVKSDLDQNAKTIVTTYRHEVA